MQIIGKIRIKKVNKNGLLFLYCLIVITIASIRFNTIAAQSLSLEKNFYTDYLRFKQLIDTNASAVSFNIRPLPLNNTIDTVYKVKQIGKFLGVGNGLLPITFSSIYNSHHPVGINQGAMIPSQSPELYLSTGLYFKHKNWEFQLQPELVYTHNSSFETFAHENYDPVWASYYKWLNKIDAPEQFGTKPYLKFGLGQSKIQYNINTTFSTSLSSENLWWGPGIHNSLVLTNNAPGFLHLSFQTIKPYKTRIGSFEFQTIIGRLENSGIAPPDTNRVMYSQPLYIPKNNEWRIFSGFIMSWQPKWVPGLFLGTARSAITYNTNFKPLDILPFSDSSKYSIGSIFFRYLLKESHAEFYGEYGNNNNQNQRGYVFGIYKVTQANSHNYHFEFNVEITQLDATTFHQIDNAESWYTSSSVTQGYTQLGKLIGAGIGPGSNSQLMDISMRKKKIKFGVTLERLVHNNDFYYNAYSPINYWKAHWVDMSALYHASFPFKNNFYINAGLGITRSLNYEWRIIPGIDPVLPGNGYDPINFHGNITIVYHW